MNIAQEPLPLFDLGGSHPNICLLLPGSTLQHGPLDVTTQLQPMPNARIPDHVSVPAGIGSEFEPRPFSEPHRSMGKLLRFC